jgi:hypothetical protein
LASIEGATLWAPAGQHDDRGLAFALALAGRALLLTRYRAGTGEGPRNPITSPTYRRHPPRTAWPALSLRAVVAGVIDGEAMRGSADDPRRPRPYLLTGAQWRSSFLEAEIGLGEEGADQMRFLAKPGDHFMPGSVAGYKCEHGCHRDGGVR